MPKRVLLVLEHRQGELKRSFAEQLGAAAALSDGGVVEGVVVAAAGAEAAADAAAAAGVARVWLASEMGVSSERVVALVQAAAQASEADVVLFAAGRASSSVAPRVALRLAAGYFEDVSTLRIADGGWEGERVAFLARATLSIRSEAPRLVATLKPGAFPATLTLGAAGRVEALSASDHELDARATLGEVRAESRGRLSLEEAERIVCGGRGLGSVAAFEEHVLGLADRLGAAVASTRAVVDAGWRPYHEQVGQTGKSVAPKLYLALALSGAVQHLSGMNRSGVIVAVNKDPDAPIFKIADYAVVADVTEFVPALRRALDRLE